MRDGNNFAFGRIELHLHAEDTARILTCVVQIEKGHSLDVWPSQTTY